MTYSFLLRQLYCQSCCAFLNAVLKKLWVILQVGYALDVVFALFSFNTNSRKVFFVVEFNEDPHLPPLLI